jgi:hypothetical protein
MRPLQFRVEGLWFSFWGLGFELKERPCAQQDLGFRVLGSGFKV